MKNHLAKQWWKEEQPKQKANNLQKENCCPKSLNTTTSLSGSTPSTPVSLKYWRSIYDNCFDFQVQRYVCWIGFSKSLPTQKGFNYISNVKRKLWTLCNVETNNCITYFSKHTFAIFFSEYPHRVHRVMRHGNLYLAVLKNIHYLYKKKQFRK